MQQDAAKEIINGLDRELRRRRRGILTKIGTLMGSDRGWWARRRSRGDLRVSELMTVLNYLGLDPVRFLRQALRRGSLELDFQRPRTEPPGIVVRALRRLSQGDREGSLDESFLKILDSVRYEKPHEALRLAEWGVNHLENALLPRFLGVLASILRHLSRLDDAEHAIFAALEVSEGQRDPIALAELVKRLAFIIAERGELDQALLVSERAMVGYLRLGDAAGVGRCVYDQAVWLNYLGRYRESIAVAKSCLDLLPTGADQNRLAANHLLAMNHYDLGAYEIALNYLEEAKKISGDNAHLAQDKIQWLLANIRADLGDLAEAEELLTQLWRRFCSYRNGEDALLICDLVSVQLRRQKTLEAFQTSQAMMKLLEPLRHDKVISAAIAELLRCGQRGLTLALVERVRKRIRGELRVTRNVRRN